MKSITTLLFALLIAIPMLAQEEKKKEQEQVPEIPEKEEVTRKDTTKMTVNGKEVVIIREEDDDEGHEYSHGYNENDDKVVSFYGKQRNRVWQAFEFGFTGVSYSASFFDTDIPEEAKFFDVNTGGSINWAINPFEMDVRIVKEYVKFSTGLGYQAKNFSLNNNYLLYKDDSTNVVMGRKETEVSLAKNRFRTGYITAPAMLYFNTNKNPRRAFRIGAGVVGGIKIFETYRLKTYEQGQKRKANANYGWNANAFMLDWRAIIGYGPINVYATQSMVSLFEKNKGPELYPFTFGISFVNTW